MSILPTPRSTYTSSGRVSWVRMAFFAVPTLAVALAMALCLYLAFAWNFYYYIFVPAVAALPVAGFAYLTVGGGHCRNKAVAGMFGLLVAAVLFLGHFYFHMVDVLADEIGLEAFIRVDFLPKFINFRMATDVALENGREQGQSTVGNWVWFAIDFLIVIAIVVVISMVRAGRAYCEACHRWMRRLTVNVSSKDGAAVLQALQPGKLETLPDIRPLEGKLEPPHASLTLGWCPNSSRQPEPCPVYLSVKEAGECSRTLLDQAEVTGDEIRALAGTIADFRPAARLAGEPEASVAEFSPRARELSPRATEPPASTGPSASPYVTSMPKEAGDQVLNKTNTTIAVMLSLMPVIAFVAGLAMIGVGLWQRPWNPDLAETRQILSYVLIGGGTVLLLFGGVVCWKCVDYFNFRFGYRVCRRAIQLRPDAIVNPDDPEAVLVDVVPRENWSGICPDHPSDSGFVKVDVRGRRLLFEGVRQRYQIPGDAICWCEVEPINPQAGALSIFATVIRTGNPDAPADAGNSDSTWLDWESPLLVRPVKFGRYGGKQRRELAEQLQDRIRKIVPF